MTAKTMAAVLAKHHMSHADWDQTANQYPRRQRSQHV